MLTRGAIQTTVEVSDGAKISVTRYNADGGDGQTPLLMINGWSCPGDLWGTFFTNGLYKTPRLTGGREVIVFDNRGIGDSSVTEGPYSVGGMANDTAEVVAALGHNKVHVLGISLGGMVAQQLASNAADSVASLVLCSTTAGGKLMTGCEKSFARSFFGSFRNWQEDDPTSQLEAMRIFIKGCLPLRNKLANDSSSVERLARSSLWAGHRTAEGIGNQLAALGWKGGLDLEGIECPALIVHGTEDQVLPFPNAKALAAAMPSARLVPLHGHGHLWNFTHESAIRTIDQFLLDVEANNLADSYTTEPSAQNYV
jgi:pimeloyl-ACP methyl ester carboxylesterase